MQNYKIASEYTWNMKIASYDTGPDLCLRISSQLKLQQETGERHLAEGGLGYTQLVENGIVFVLVRARSTIRRAPRFGEKVSITTWNRGVKGVRFSRCYRFSDKNGNSLIESISEFVIVDPNTHALLRPDSFTRYGIEAYPERFIGCPMPGKIRSPIGLGNRCERMLRWSDTDCNRHVSNTVYADIACDAVPSGMHNRRLIGFAIDYKNEAREGEALFLSSGENIENDVLTAWITGSLGNGNPCFDAQIDFTCL